MTSLDCAAPGRSLSQTKRCGVCNTVRQRVARHCESDRLV